MCEGVFPSVLPVRVSQTPGSDSYCNQIMSRNAAPAGPRPQTPPGCAVAAQWNVVLKTTNLTRLHYTLGAQSRPLCRITLEM